MKTTFTDKTLFGRPPKTAVINRADVVLKSGAGSDVKITRGDFEDARNAKNLAELNPTTAWSSTPDVTKMARELAYCFYHPHAADRPTDILGLFERVRQEMSSAHQKQFVYSFADGVAMISLVGVAEPALTVPVTPTGAAQVAMAVLDEEAVPNDHDIADLLCASGLLDDELFWPASNEQKQQLARLLAAPMYTPLAQTFGWNTQVSSQLEESKQSETLGQSGAKPALGGGVPKLTLSAQGEKGDFRATVVYPGAKKIQVSYIVSHHDVLCVEVRHLASSEPAPKMGLSELTSKASMWEAHG